MRGGDTGREGEGKRDRGRETGREVAGREKTSLYINLLRS